MLTFPNQAAPAGVTNLQERKTHVQQVLNNTSNWASVTSLSQIETMASDLHQCRCGADLKDLRGPGAKQLERLLTEVDTRVTECWNRYAELQSSYLDTDTTSHIDADSKALIQSMLAEDMANNTTLTTPPKKRDAQNNDIGQADAQNARSVRQRTGDAVSIPNRGIPNQGNTCFINTPLAALGMSSGVSRAVDERIQTLENNPSDTEAPTHLPVLRSLKTCINHINGTQPLNHDDIFQAVTQLGTNMVAALGNDYAELTQNIQLDASTDFLMPLVANFLPNYCPEGSIVRTSTGPSETNPLETETTYINEVGNISFKLAEMPDDEPLTLTTLLDAHFNPQAHQREGTPSQPERNLSTEAPENLLIILDRTQQRSEAENPLTSDTQQGYHPERQIRLDRNVGLPENGEVAIKGQKYRIEAMGLHHPSGAPNANINERGGHYTCFVSDTNSSSLGQGLRFNDSSVIAESCDHDSLEKGVVFLTLKKV